MANKVSNTDDILELGEKNTAVEEQKKKKKKMIFPVMLMIIGIILMLGGIFFKQVTAFLGINLNKGELKEKQIVSISETLVCNYKQTDDSLGINTEIENKYVLDEKKLTSMVQKRTIKADLNKEISESNLKIINGKYDDLINNIGNNNGITIKDSLQDNILTVSIEVDFKTFDAKSFPVNELVTITNYYNQERRSIKEIEVKAGHLCK